MRVLIVDDEPLGRDCVRLALADETDVEIVGECESGASAIVAIADAQPDLVILDVQMPEVDGFEVIRRVGRDKMPLVVFVTAFDAHALHAFDVHALDYVLKPFDDERFREAIARARQLLVMRRAGGAAQPVPEIVSPVGGAEPRAGYVSRITVKHDGRIYFVTTREIDYVEAAGNYVKLHARGGEHSIRSTIRALAAQLNPERFTRIHKSTIVNVEKIREIQPWFGGDYVAILLDGTQLRVSRTYVPALLRPFR